MGLKVEKKAVSARMRMMMVNGNIVTEETVCRLCETGFLAVPRPPENSSGPLKNLLDAGLRATHTPCHTAVRLLLLQHWPVRD